MTAYSIAPPKIEAIAHLLRADRIATGRWRGRCPVHRDNTPSLDITSGRDGRVLVLCRAGCRTADVLKAAGLGWRDLYPDGPPLTPDQRTALQRDREECEAARRRIRQLHCEGCDRLHAMQDFIDELALRLVDIADSDEAARLTATLHQTFEDVRRLEMALRIVERGIGR